MSDTKDSDSKRDYRATLFLPSTDFPMKAGLPEAEPKWLKRWEEMGLYAKLREAAKGRPSTCCMTARPMPMATFISAPR